MALLLGIEADVMHARSRRGAWMIGPLAIVVATVLGMAQAEAGTGTAVPGGQGIDTSLPPTDSQVTVRGRGIFADLAITVNQTTKLTNQAVSITWTGGKPTITSPGIFSGNYLQVMQCWGDDDGTVAANPGPSPEQCVQGAIGSTTPPPSNTYPDPYAVSRIIGVVGWPNLDTSAGVVDPRSGFLWRPFRAVNGTKVDIQTDPTFLVGTTGGNSWLNPFFNSVTTNEIAGAKTGVDGKGAELFEVHTGLESSGLGCGQKGQPVTGGGTKVPRCWLVVVPRADAIVENAGTPFATGDLTNPVSISPMAPSAWKNRIAIPLDFAPLDSPCTLGADERRVAGSDLIGTAISSWQPALCSVPGAPPYSFAPVSDAAARQQLSSSAPGGPGLVVVSAPLSATAVDPKSSALYAPISVSGLTIGVTIERNPKFGAPEAEVALSGVRVADIRLTPRLVAKLLTQSYRQQVAIAGATPTTYTWVTANPLSMATDPDFLQFNPEFELLLPSDERTFGGLQLPAGGSDAAEVMWQWILSDPEAAAWLRGDTDAWGMKVNPQYSTDPQRNPTGSAFGTPTPSSFPKADPYCYQGAPRGPNNSIVPPQLCGTDWMPYARNYAETAKVARTAFDGARIVENPLALSSSQVWTRSTPQYVGKRAMLSLTDTPSAARYGLQMARLSRSGDNGADREFVAPNAAGLAAGVAAMTVGSEPGILVPAPGTKAPGAYPLTVVAYGAIKPLSLDSTARTQYAAFLDYAAGPGQVPGLDLGMLPRGYAPITDAMKAQTRAVAEQVRTMTAAAPTTTTPATVPASVPVASKPTTSKPTTSKPPTSATTTSTVAPEGLVTDTVPDTSTTVPQTTVPDTTAATTTTGPVAITPISDPPTGRLAVAGVGVLALGSALGALEITKRARKPVALAAAAAASAAAATGDAATMLTIEPGAPA